MCCVVCFCCADVRQQLGDQLKCLDVRLESHVTMLGELQDFYRRRSEVELEYSRGIDKLVKQIMARHKTDKQKSVSQIRCSVCKKRNFRGYARMQTQLLEYPILSCYQQTRSF